MGASRPHGQFDIYGITKNGRREKPFEYGTTPRRRINSLRSHYFEVDDSIPEEPKEKR